MIKQVYYRLVFYYTCTCIDKSMQIVLERGSIDKPLTFNIGLLQLIFHTSVFTEYICMQGVFNPNIPIFPPNSVKGLHFSAFHLFIFFYIDRSLSYYIVLTYFSKLLKLRFLSHYIWLSYFSKLLRLRFLTHYTLITYFCKPVEVFNTKFCLLIFLSCCS